MTVKWPWPRLIPRLSWLWQEWKAIPNNPKCQLSYGLTENWLKNSKYVPLDLSAMAGEMMHSFWELQSTRTFSWESSWWWKLLRILFPATHGSYVAGSCVVKNSRVVGWRSDYDGHQSKEASKEFKISFIGIVYKATWKAMKKHSSYCIVSQHFFTWGWDQISINFDLQWEEVSVFICCGNTSWTKFLSS